jgi:nucleotide-binding universal stress UspA family protein
MAAVLLGLWAFEALVLGYVMRLRGFDGYVWTILGAFLGPIAVVLAVTFVLRPPHTQPNLVRLGRGGTGHRHVLVGIDGSPESEAALERVVALFGRDLGRLVVARVIPTDASNSTEAAAEQKLRDLADRHASLQPSLVVLRGEPALALRSYASTQHFDLIAVGSRGAGFTQALLGSVATELAAGSSVPVLTVDTAAAHVDAT